MSDKGDLPELPPDAFGKWDSSPDEDFYREPRFVAHIDDHAIAAVTDLYRALFPPGGAILDLMSSWISHLPDDVQYSAVIGLGLNEAELAANPRLDRRIVQNLNAEPALPLESDSVDAAGICVSIQYLEQPVAVLREAARVLRPGAPLAVTFSNRCFPTKAVAIWQALGGEDQMRLVILYLARAGFERIEARTLARPNGVTDPLWAVIGHKPTG